MEPSDLVFPVHVEMPITISYDPETGRLAIDYVAFHPARPGGIPTSIRLDAEGSRALRNAIQQIETQLGMPIGSPATPRSAQ